MCMLDLAVVSGHHPRANLSLTRKESLESLSGQTSLVKAVSHGCAAKMAGIAIRG